MISFKAKIQKTHNTETFVMIANCNNNEINPTNVIFLRKHSAVALSANM